jgi:predicted DNA-binding protein
MKRLKATFTLDEKMLEELSAFSEGFSQKKSHIVEKALNLYFDMMDNKLAEKIMSDVEKGKEELIDAEDVYKSLGLD